MVKKSNTITVNDTPISVVLSSDMNNYICITDMIRAQEGGRYGTYECGDSKLDEIKGHHRIPWVLGTVEQSEF